MKYKVISCLNSWHISLALYRIRSDELDYDQVYITFKDVILYLTEIGNNDMLSD